VFALFDVDFVFFFVVVVPDAPPIIIIILYSHLESTRHTTNESATFRARRILESHTESSFFDAKENVSTPSKSVARRFGSFFAPRKSRSIIRVNPVHLGNPKVCRKQTKFFFASETHTRERNVIPTTTRV
jgi:hypothetical protein